jgi:hypothetical protein
MLFNLKALPLAVATLLFATTANACMEFDAVKFADTVVSAQIHDDGTNTCNFPNSAATGLDGHYWLTCITGFASFITSDMGTLAYSAHGGDYRFATTNIGTQYECDPLTHGCGTSTRYHTSAFC